MTVSDIRDELVAALQRSAHPQLAWLLNLEICEDPDRVQVGGRLPSFTLKQTAITAITPVAKDHGLLVDASPCHVDCR